MQTETASFLDELLAETEIKEEKQSLAYYDLLVMEIGKLETEIENNFTECDREIAIIKEWTLKRNSVIQEKCELLKLRLESFIKQVGKKTIELPHGTLKLRKQPDKVDITDMVVFLANADSQMVSIVPETIKPDLTKIKSYIKMTTKVPDGVNVIEGKEEFRLTLRKNDSNAPVL